MLLCLFVFESLGTLNVSHLRRSMCYCQGGKGGYLVASCIRESSARNEHFAN